VFNSPEWDFDSAGSAGALRSCLRAPTLSYLAHATNGLIVGTGNRSEDRITRYYQKFGDGCVDFSPIADLHKSEVRELFRYLASVDIDNNGIMNPGAAAIYHAKPTADLWGADSGQEDEKELGISYEEIEWADREDVKTPLIFRETPPNVESKFGNYTGRQQEILMKLWKMEKVSRHKSNPNMPICIVHTDDSKLVE
jgi:NAD+ synthase